MFALSFVLFAPSKLVQQQPGFGLIQKHDFKEEQNQRSHSNYF